MDPCEHLLSSTGQKKERRWTTGRESHLTESSTEQPGDRGWQTEAVFTQSGKVLPGESFGKKESVSITTDNPHCAF